MSFRIGFRTAARVAKSFRRPAGDGLALAGSHRALLTERPMARLYSRNALRSFAAVAMPETVLDGISFGDLLRYLDQHYGLAHQVVEEKLAELANILGYEGVNRNTTINFSDTRILMEEVGTYPATPFELTSWRAEQEEEEHEHEPGHKVTDQENGVQMFYHVQNYPELLEMARKHGATVEPCNKQGWTRVTTASNDVILFKSVKGKLRWSNEIAVEI